MNFFRPVANGGEDRYFQTESSLEVASCASCSSIHFRNSSGVSIVT